MEGRVIESSKCCYNKYINEMGQLVELGPGLSPQKLKVLAPLYPTSGA